jgi:phospholipid/cholesterol/gamma-HCH transport system ATP-binding protein
MIAPLTTAVRDQPLPEIAETVIEVRNLTKRYGRNIVHQHLDFDVRRGEIVSIVGGSGSGKTTLMRQILGLERPTSGSIKVFGEDMATLDKEEARLMRVRSGMLFQHGALFSSLSVFDNIAQPLRELGKVPEDLLRDIVMLKLEMVGLPCKHASKMPAALSGGMVKRVGIARAIALEPELLFLDEPTAGLDPQASDEFVELISALHRALGLTVVMVTHDLDTMVALSTRVAVIADRKVIALGTPRELIASLGAEHVIEFGVGQQNGSISESALRTLPSVESVAFDAGSWRLTVREVHRTVPALLAALAERGAAPDHLATHHATLEDVFMTLTGRSLRDG